MDKFQLLLNGRNSITNSAQVVTVAILSVGLSTKLLTVEGAKFSLMVVEPLEIQTVEFGMLVKYFLLISARLFQIVIGLRNGLIWISELICLQNSANT